jgi:hypothetical protein
MSTCRRLGIFSCRFSAEDYNISKIFEPLANSRREDRATSINSLSSATAVETNNISLTPSGKTKSPPTKRRRADPRANRYLTHHLALSQTIAGTRTKPAEGLPARCATVNRLGDVVR